MSVWKQETVWYLLEIRSCCVCYWIQTTLKHHLKVKDSRREKTAMAFYDRFRSLNCILALIELVSYLILHFDFRRSFCNCFFCLPGLYFLLHFLLTSRLSRPWSIHRQQSPGILWAQSWDIPASDCIRLLSDNSNRCFNDLLQRSSKICGPK